MPKSLYQKLIRLAYVSPEMRPALLPLLRKAEEYDTIKDQMLERGNHPYKPRPRYPTPPTKYPVLNRKGPDFQVDGLTDKQRPLKTYAKVHQDGDGFISISVVLTVITQGSIQGDVQEVIRQWERVASRNPNLEFTATKIPGHYTGTTLTLKGSYRYAEAESKHRDAQVVEDVDEAVADFERKVRPVLR